MFNPPLYLDRFTNLVKAPKGRMHGSSVLIEILDEEEEKKSEGGIILTKSSHARNEYDMLNCIMGLVLYTGEGFYNRETNETQGLDVNTGNVIQISAMALQWYTTLPLIKEGIPAKRLGILDNSAIIWSWDTMEDYVMDVEALNDGDV